MARRTQTYAIRLAVEGGGQVKAELVSVGQSGEQSLKRIESAGERASGGLRGLGRQAELLRTGIRTLGGALIGAATVGGLGALIDRSISAADAIGKTADKIGVGLGALQELRFAAMRSCIIAPAGEIPGGARSNRPRTLWTGRRPQVHDLLAPVYTWGGRGEACGPACACRAMSARSTAQVEDRPDEDVIDLSPAARDCGGLALGGVVGVMRRRW